MTFDNLFFYPLNQITAIILAVIFLRIHFNPMTMIIRPDGRAFNELRPITIQTGIAPYAAGSVLIGFGNTQVICAACLESSVPRWMKEQGIEGGWMTAEYSMLPYSTLDRKQRDITKGKQDGRSIEIQRLIGRTLRAVTNLKYLTGHTLHIDCDVLQADGGTRTASITGAYIAAQIAVAKLLKAKKILQNPFVDSVAAISTGIYQETPILDLCYLEDKDASVDANIVITGSGRFVEIQSSGEESTFSEEDFTQLVSLAKKGAAELTLLQNATLAKEYALMK